MANPGYLAQARALIQRIAENPMLAQDGRIMQGLARLKSFLSLSSSPSPVPMPQDGGLSQEANANSIQPNDPQLEAKLHYLWQLSGSNPKAYLDYVRQVPDPSISGLANNPALLKGITESMVRREGIQKPPPPGDGMEAPQYQSSNVAGYAYDPGKQRLFVKFHGGSVYGYESVPSWIFDLFKDGAASARTTGSNDRGSWWIGKNPSLGASVWKYLREAGLPYAKLK